MEEESTWKILVKKILLLANLTKMYSTRMKHLGVELDLRVHATRLKERILAHFPDMQSIRRGETSI